MHLKFMLRSCVVLLVGAWSALPIQALGQEPSSLGAVDFGQLTATLHTTSPIIQAGRPVWVTFSITNLAPAPQRIAPTGEPAASADHEHMGLPLGHIFSAETGDDVIIRNARGEPASGAMAGPDITETPSIRLDANCSVGQRVNLARYYDVLGRPGIYDLTWRPYGGLLKSNSLRIEVLAEKQAVLITDFGKITMRFYYDRAPRHVQNFLELVESRFYDGLTFNRVIPGGLIQGGSPRGDRFGVRPDGKRLKAEFNDIPFEYGTVGMARTPADPDSASSQFFICLSRQPSFDGRQTAFAYVVYDHSFDTLRRIEAAPVDERDRPVRPMYIRAISLESVPVRERRDTGSEMPRTGADTPHDSQQEAGPAAQGTPGNTDGLAVGHAPDPKADVTTRPAADLGG